jgi:hypothetical protein
MGGGGQQQQLSTFKLIFPVLSSSNSLNACQHDAE